MCTKTCLVLFDDTKQVSLLFERPNSHNHVAFLVPNFPHLPMGMDGSVLVVGMVGNLFFHCFDEFVSIWFLHGFGKMPVGESC
jgi:hypothetical protein